MRRSLLVVAYAFVAGVVAFSVWLGAALERGDVPLPIGWEWAAAGLGAGVAAFAAGLRPLIEVGRDSRSGRARLRVRWSSWGTDSPRVRRAASARGGRRGSA